MCVCVLERVRAPEHVCVHFWRVPTWPSVRPQIVFSALSCRFPNAFMKFPPIPQALSVSLFLLFPNVGYSPLNLDK